jgi:hypothetical protein
MFSIAAVTSYFFSITVVAEREQENNIDGSNPDEDFEAQNTIRKLNQATSGRSS